VNGISYYYIMKSDSNTEPVESMVLILSLHGQGPINDARKSFIL
jgi:hypothetical protein